jgi:hypothetical protein
MKVEDELKWKILRRLYSYGEQLGELEEIWEV